MSDIENRAAGDVIDCYDPVNHAQRVVIVDGGGIGATQVDGADATQGAIADAAVVSDANGTLSGKLRGLVKMLADVWDSARHALKVTRLKGTKTFTVVTVPSSAGGIQLLAANANRFSASICNNGAATIFLFNDNTVTTANGLPLKTGQMLADADTKDAWWAIAASGTVDTRIMEVA